MYPGEWIIFLQHEGDKPMTWVMYGVYARKEYAVKAASQVGAKRKLVVQVGRQDNRGGEKVLVSRKARGWRWLLGME